MKLDLQVSHETESEIPKSMWTKMVAQYQQPDVRASIWQVITSFVPFFVVWYLMALSLQYSYILTLLLAFPAAGFVTRMFIIQHDCGHASFFQSRFANNLVGTVAGVFTLTPYLYWRKSHAIHHAHASNLEERGIGDIYTMTVSEYIQASKWGKLKYRVYRNPFFLFGLAPSILFLILHRIPYSASKSWKPEERASVHWNNLAIAAIAVAVSYFIGFKAFFMIEIPIMVIAASAGTWMFYVQHQFEDTYWASKPDWDYALAAMQGSSYYRLPKVLQWFTGNIGFHHIHHLSPRIPNYRLEQCHTENPLFQRAVVLTILDSLKTAVLTLWDEERKKLISFGELKALKKSAGMVNAKATAG
ncbi:MAG: fatty acid desaturase [Chloroflexi bacterium]|nr:fatty acid desaturase [Chloroflexota bacterium]